MGPSRMDVTAGLGESDPLEPPPLVRPQLLARPSLHRKHCKNACIDISTSVMTKQAWWGPMWHGLRNDPSLYRDAQKGKKGKIEGKQYQFITVETRAWLQNLRRQRDDGTIVASGAEAPDAMTCRMHGKGDALRVAGVAEPLLNI